MSARVEITKKYARAYAKASKKERGRLLDEVVGVTGWSRDNARRRLAAAARPGPRPVTTRKPRGRKFSYDATKTLQRVWAFSGGQCGKYLAVSMPHLLDALERHGELALGKKRYSLSVRAELLETSPATIDRYLAPVKQNEPIRGLAATKPSPLLRSSITVRKAGDEVEDSPGFFEGDTVAHCGPNHDVIDWSAGRKIFFTRSRPYKKNDQATIESKNNHLVRRHAFHWRYDDPNALIVLNLLWPLVNDRMNFLTPTKKPIDWKTPPTGRRTRIYDASRTPFERLLDAGVLSPAQAKELTAYRDGLNPAELMRRIVSLQDRLTAIAKRPTLDLEASLAAPLPDTNRGVKVRGTA